jgi:5-methylcytosine-specific restriction enzyme A
MPTKPISHSQRQRKKADKTRKQGDNFTSCSRWRKLRIVYLRQHPICNRCKEALATTVHHKKDRKTNPELSYEWGNLEALCKQCHDRHTAASTIAIR